MIRASRLRSRRDWSGIGGNSRDSSRDQHCLDLAREPRRMTWLEYHIAGVVISQGIEEGARDPGVKRQAWRKLDQNRTEFASQSCRLSKKLVEGRSGIHELRLMRDRLRELYGKSKVVRNRCSPPLVRCQSMRPIKAGVDLDRIKEARVALEVSSSRGKPLGVLAANVPARGAQADRRVECFVWNIGVHRPTLTAVSCLLRRLCAAASIAVVLSSCFHSPAVLRQARHLNYWEALAELRPDEAVESARTPAEKEFAESLKALMEGDIAKAENGFGDLRRTAKDSIIRSGSRVIYTATLQYQEKWPALAALKTDQGGSRADSTDKASIELWADAFRNVPPKSLTFESQSTRLDMTVSAVGTPLVPVRIGGRVYNFWLDTGSSMTMLASDVASDLNVLPIVSDTLEIVTSTGRVSAMPAVIPELRIGQVVVRNAPTMIVNETMMRMREPKPVNQAPQVKIDGIIGFDIIRQLDVEVDYGDGVIRVRNPAYSRHEANRNMFWVGLPVVRITSTDGIPLHFALDTGAQLTFVTETLLDKLQLEAARIENRRVGGLGGEVSLRAPVLPDLRAVVRGFPIVFRGAFVRAPVYQVLAALDGVLGGDVWDTGIVRIDMTNGIFAIRRRQPD
jgi:predicted aspartyl protease